MFDDKEVPDFAGIMAKQIASEMDKAILDAIYGEYKKDQSNPRSTGYVVKKGSAIFVAMEGDVWVESIATRDICFSDADLLEDEEGVLTFNKMFNGVVWGLQIKKELVRC